MKLIDCSHIKRGDFLFFPAWALYIATVILDTSVFALDGNALFSLDKIIRYVIYGICIIKICTTSYRSADIIPILFFLLVFILSYYKSHNRTMMLYSLIMLASYKLSNDKIIKTTCYMQGLLLLIIVLLSQTGIIMDYVFDKGTRERHSMGFVWTTIAPIIFFYYVMGYVYINRRKLKKSRLILFEIISIWFYLKTNTKLVFTLTSLFIMFVLFETLNRKRYKFLSRFKLIYIAYPFLMWFFILVVCRLYNRDSSTWIKINNMLTGRLTLSQDAINYYGINLLGHNVEWKGFSINHASYDVGEYNYVDSSYLQLTINYGVIFMVVVLAVFSYAIYKHIKANDYYTVVIYIFILTLTLTEPQLMNFSFNPFSLLAFGMIAKDINDLMSSKYIHRYKKKWRLS